MRKLIVSQNVSLDGVMEAPDVWAFPYHGEDVTQVLQEDMHASDAMLFGRITYESFAAFWPHQAEDPAGIVRHLNTTSKYVVSRTLQSVDWQNAMLIANDPLTEITNLKNKPGAQIVVTGSATLVDWLLEHDLVDEIRLFVHPLVVGNGKRLFNGPLTSKRFELVDTHTFASGVVLLRYGHEHSPAQTESNKR